jgi:sugar transferase EpsL
VERDVVDIPCGGSIKRSLDLLIAIPAAIVLLPLFLITALLVRVKLGRPVFFRQMRPGWQGRPFELLKFRTMIDERDARGHLSPDDQRVTSFGRVLRQASLDELPEMINVLRGEMSLVGPRPLLMAYLERYAPWQARRHEARPGITGLAQVSGRNLLSWDERFTLDVWYVDHWSMALDIRILCLTFWKVLTREGASPEGRATSPEFKGPPT